MVDARLSDRPLISVVIGLASSFDTQKILEVLSAIDASDVDFQYEVILADRRSDSISLGIKQQYPDIHLFSCPATMSLPEMHSDALARCRGQFVAVTEDHCVPTRNWLGSICSAFAAAPASVVAVGGSVANATPQRARDWATFLCEYVNFHAPVPNGIVAALPGMNVAYLRSALAEVPAERLVGGFWETTVHPYLQSRGYQLFSSEAMIVNHGKRFPLLFFTSQRFLYSRYFAGRRFASDQVLFRGAAAVGSLVLAPLIFSRIARRAVAKGLTREVIRASPFLLLFCLAWAAGEFVGYVAGPGDALSRLE